MSGETKFTDGPWWTDGILINSATDPVCLMGEPAQYAGDTSAMCCNHEANAHLIAASPELYDALEELATLMDDVLSGSYRPDSFTTQPARNALRKARGESQ